MEDLKFIDQDTLKTIIKAIKQSFTRYSTTYKEFLKASGVKEGPRNGLRWICKMCETKCDRKMMQVDHIDPHIPIEKLPNELSFYELYNRCFTTESNLQILCKKCHRLKSRGELKLRNQSKIKRGIVSPPRKCKKKET